MRLKIEKRSKAEISLDEGLPRTLDQIHLCLSARGNFSNRKHL